MLDRRNLQTQIDMFISHIKATVENQEKLIRDVKRTEDRLKIELAEVSVFQNCIMFMTHFCIHVIVYIFFSDKTSVRLFT